MSLSSRPFPCLRAGMCGLGAVIKAEFALAGFTPEGKEVELVAEWHLAVCANGVDVGSGHFGKRLFLCRGLRGFGGSHIEINFRVYMTGGSRGLEMLVTQWPAAWEISHCHGGEEGSRKVTLNRPLAMPMSWDTLCFGPHPSDDSSSQFGTRTGRFYLWSARTFPSCPS